MISDFKQQNDLNYLMLGRSLFGQGPKGWETDENRAGDRKKLQRLSFFVSDLFLILSLFILFPLPTPQVGHKTEIVFLPLSYATCF